MPVVVSGGSVRTIMLWCTILCTLVNGKWIRNFKYIVSLASIVAGCQHYRKHFGKLSSVGRKKKYILNVKTRGDLNACVLQC